VSKDTAAARWRCFDPDKALSPALFRGDSLACARPPNPATNGGNPAPEPPPAESAACDADHAGEVAYCHAAGTTAFTVADADGNVVAVTQTLGTWGGNFYVSPGLGFLYNDKLTSYGTDPNAYGARLPYARHGSSLAPTIVFKGTRPVLAVGAAGNAWITSAVYQTLTGMLDQKLGPQQALELPRFLLGGQRTVQGRRESVIEMEDGFSPEVIERLKQMGYAVNYISLPGELRMGYGAAVRIGEKEVTAGADPRRAGAAGAIK
jgi:gamma-glutamyltranspeptidase